MSTMEELKMYRSLAAEKTSTSNDKLSEAIEKGRSRMVDKYHKEVLTNFSAFEDYHIQYAIKAKLNLEDPEMKNLFFGVSGVVDLAETNYSDYKDQLLGQVG